MKFVVLFEDNPEETELRTKYMPDHLAFLDRNKDKIDAAGPLVEVDGAGAGGLWLVDVANAEETRRLVEEDPFWPTGLRKSFRVLAWKQVFAHGKQLIP